MLKIFECQPYNIHRQGLGEFASMLRVEAKAVLLELRLHILTGATILTINRRFYDHARRTLVRGLRNLHDNITIYSVHACVLQERVRNMKNLKFTPGSGRIGRYRRVLCPGKNDRDRDFLGSDIGDWDMLGQMPIISDVRL